MGKAGKEGKGDVGGSMSLTEEALRATYESLLIGGNTPSVVLIRPDAARFYGIDVDAVPSEDSEAE